VPAKRLGVCHICGIHGPLSFEHIPPKAAFNNQPIVRVAMDEAMGLMPGNPIPKGKIQQQGLGDYTLCDRCNSQIGHWYGTEYVEWCVSAIELLRASGGRPSLIHLYHMYPLRVLKQIVAIFFSVNSDQFRRAHPELVDFVLGRDKVYLPPRYHFYVYYNIEGHIRSQSYCARMNFFTGEIIGFTEFTFRPFGYVMTLDKPDTSPPDRRLFEISHFARYHYHEFARVQLQPPVLPTHLLIPGDYRTTKEIEEHMRQQNSAA
jgi:hypothetical protein